MTKEKKLMKNYKNTWKKSKRLPLLVLIFEK